MDTVARALDLQFSHDTETEDPERAMATILDKKGHLL
jgi:hypothetical protein